MDQMIICIGKQSMWSFVRSASMADHTSVLVAFSSINSKQKRTLNPEATEYIPVNHHWNSSSCGFFYYQQHPPAISLIAAPYTIFPLPRPPPPLYFPHVFTLTPPSHFPQFVPPPPLPPQVISPPQPVTHFFQREPESERLLEKAQVGGRIRGSFINGSKRWGSRGRGVWRMKSGSSSAEASQSQGESSKNRAVKPSTEDGDEGEDSWRIVKYRVCVKKGIKFEIEPVEKATSKTTVMIRNIPSRYTREIMLNFLDWHCTEVNQKLKKDSPKEGVEVGGFLSAYDFFYMPMDFKTGLNKSYAFVNFTSPEAVWRFHNCCDGQKWELFRSNKIRQIAFAKHQGIKELTQHFGKTVFACQSDEFLPVHFQPPRDGRAEMDTVPILVGKRVPRHSRYI